MKNDERFVLATPLQDGFGGELQAINRVWSEHQDCWFLLGEVFYKEREQLDSMNLNVNIPEGRSQLMPGEFFVKDRDEMEHLTKNLVGSGILVDTAKSVKSGFVDFPVFIFRKDKCSSRFHCDQCDHLADSDQSFYSEFMGKVLCLRCQAILEGDIEIETDFEKEAFKMIDKIDRLDLG